MRCVVATLAPPRSRLDSVVSYPNYNGTSSTFSNITLPLAWMLEFQPHTISLGLQAGRPRGKNPASDLVLPCRDDEPNGHADARCCQYYVRLSYRPCIEELTNTLLSPNALMACEQIVQASAAENVVSGVL